MKRRWQGISYEREKSFSSRFTSEPLKLSSLQSRWERNQVRVEFISKFLLMLQVNSWIHRGAEDRRTTLQTHDDVTIHRFKPKIKRIYSILFYFFSIDYFFVTVRSCCIETSSRWRQKLLQHRRRRRQNKTTWSKVSDVLNNGENRTRRRPARFISQLRQEQLTVPYVWIYSEKYISLIFLMFFLFLFAVTSHRRGERHSWTDSAHVQHRL